jgi:23S rRNA (adenine2503-C2)-methyltransferase
MESLFKLNFNDLESLLEKNGFNPGLAANIFDHFYKFKPTNKENLPTDFFHKINSFLSIELPSIVTTQKAEDGTIKFLIEFDDGKRVESVLIPFHKKYTVCLSSQVGCAMNCSFCFTGTQGLSRNLKLHEILVQYLIAFSHAKSIDPLCPAPNIVFMGQGEPLHNFDEVKKAIEFFLDIKAFNLGPRQITVSSAGYLPGLNRFNELFGVNLAISFHSPKNEVRNQLIPINQKYPIEELVKVLKTIPLKKRQYITFEYLLIDELNDTNEDASMLANTLSALNPIINIIPFNPFPGSKFKRPSILKVEQFKNFLVENRLRTMIRTTKGDEILAACGQLNTKSL